MSQPFSRFLHPFDVAHHPSLEPEVKRAILASWASDRSAVKDQPAMRKPPGARRAVPIDEVFAAMRSLDEPRTDSRPLQ
ncbi:hypothetical protein [Sphingobium yanoikuyae]|uniref:Uncharacterized protein n=1 Tax=Sphingobium yanoikuyae TaxID=13690 RepID=A0A291MYB8_SPHYA|nr:hypothetical protein [Sphingobium yanoikuyae]ATI79925.1 hypothetical protein A6768_07805 [Sphingobium yanoikuyae]